VPTAPNLAGRHAQVLIRRNEEHRARPRRERRSTSVDVAQSWLGESPCETPRRPVAGATTHSERPGSNDFVAAGQTATQGIPSMSRKLFNNTLAALCTFALLFAVTVGVDAQSDDPIFEEDVICSIKVGPNFYVVPVDLRPALEAYLGATATVEPMSSFLGRVGPANPLKSVRFEGGYPGTSVAQSLGGLGYNTSTSVTPELAGANTAVTLTA